MWLNQAGLYLQNMCEVADSLVDLASLEISGISARQRVGTESAKIAPRRARRCSGSIMTRRQGSCGRKEKRVKGRLYYKVISLCENQRTWSIENCPFGTAPRDLDRCHLACGPYISALTWSRLHRTLQAIHSTVLLVRLS